MVGILEKDSQLLDDYVNNFLKIEGKNFEIFSQCCYTLDTSSDCKIDMVIENNEKLIFIENKVDSLEGNGQLEKYSKYLRQVGDKECHLCYCTKITDEKKINFPNFNQFRWNDIYDYYKDIKKELIIEFLEFLEEEGIVMNKKFNSIDMLVMENIVETIAKMDEVLNEVSKHLEKEFKVNCNKHSSRSTQICKRLRYPVYGSNILKCNGYSEILGNELEGYVHNNGINIFLAEPIQDFLSSETQVEDMKSWFKEQIEIMVKFKNETPNFGWK